MLISAPSGPPGSAQPRSPRTRTSRPCRTRIDRPERQPDTWKWTSSRRPRAADRRDTATFQALGGMRHPAIAVRRLARARQVGEYIRQRLEGLLQRAPQLLRRCIVAVGSQEPDAGPNESDLIASRRILARYLGASDIGAMHSELYNTEIRASLLSALAHKATGPGVGVTMTRGDPGILPVGCTEDDLATEEKLSRICRHRLRPGPGRGRRLRELHLGGQVRRCRRRGRAAHGHRLRQHLQMLRGVRRMARRATPPLEARPPRNLQERRDEVQPHLRLQAGPRWQRASMASRLRRGWRRGSPSREARTSPATSWPSPA